MKSTIKTSEETDAAQIGKMFVTEVRFQWHPAGNRYVGDKYIQCPAAWEINASLSENTGFNSGKSQSMIITVEKGVGQKLVEVLMPVIIADASRKAQALADESKAMLQALNERCIACITDMQATESKTVPNTTIET